MTLTAFLGPRPVLVAYTDYAVTRLRLLFEAHGDEFSPERVIYLRDVFHDIFVHSDLPDYKFDTLCEVYGGADGLMIDDCFRGRTLERTAKMIEIMTRFARKIFCSKPPKDLEKVKVYGVTYYPGFKGITRIYINTSVGSLYYDCVYDRILARDLQGKEAQALFERIDMPALMEDVFELTGTKSYKELARFKGEAGYGK